MLAGVGRGGVVGIAALPGPLRRPFGYTRPLVRRRDYVGLRIGVYPGRVEAATLRSLGATTRDYLNLSGASREGAILNFGGIASGTGYRGKTLAANVVFWPRAEAVVMNRQAFAALRPAQRQILRDAGRRAVAPRLAEVRRLEDAALRTICDRRLAELVSVPADDVAELAAAVRPVYAQLDRNAQTRELIGEIRKLQTRVGTVGVEEAQCPEPGATGLSALAGSWTSSATRGELLAQGASAAEASTYAGAGRLELKDGRWSFRGERTTVTGTYRIQRDEIALTMRTCTANPCSPGAATDYAWSVYRDRLFLRPGRDLPVWPRLVARPFTRVR
jgi:hypothetical protein